MKITDLRPIPRAGLSLTALGLGCAQLGGLYRPTSTAEAAGVVEAAWNAGIRYFDTAPYYGYTRSERRLGGLLSEHPRADFVLSTKVGRLMRPDEGVGADENGWAAPLPFRPEYDYSHAGIMRSFEDSLQRLGLARIDILFVHDIGRLTHGDRHEHYWQQLTRHGGFRALDDLRRSGQVKAVGLGVNEWQVVREAMQEFDLDCTMLAGRYTLLEQGSLAPFLEECVRARNAIIVAGVFNSGILAGNNKFDYAEAPPETVARVQALARVCAEFDVALPAAALQFPIAHPAVVSCVVGVRTGDQLAVNIDRFQAPIPPEFWRALQERGLLDPAAPVPLPAAA